MIDRLSLDSENPRVTAMLALAALTALDSSPDLGAAVLTVVAPGAPPIVLDTLAALLDIAARLGSHNPQWAKTAATKIYGVKNPTLADVAAFRDLTLSNARGLAWATLSTTRPVGAGVGQW